MEKPLAPIRSLERKLVRHCTPTLAGLKPASLFTVPAKAARTECEPRLLNACRARLEPRGVRLEVLARRDSGALLFVYRPALLTETILEPEVSSRLREAGYRPECLSSCIERLHHRICGTDLESALKNACEFPHEIGFFLGYPADDVVGFIENHGANSLCSGCWKVYANARDAQACFCRYKNCTDLYQSLFDGGATLEGLTALDVNVSAEMPAAVNAAPLSPSSSARTAHARAEYSPSAVMASR